VIDLQERFKRLLGEDDTDQLLEVLFQETLAVKKLRSYVLNNSVIVSEDPLSRSC